MFVKTKGKMPPPEELRCLCDCDNCCDEPTYGADYCKCRAGSSSLGFCPKTGYTPVHSWRNTYNWQRINSVHYRHRAFWNELDMDDMWRRPRLGLS